MPANHGIFHGNLDDKVSNSHEIPAATNRNNFLCESKLQTTRTLFWLSCGRQILRFVRILPKTLIINAWASSSSPLATPSPPRDLPHSPGTSQLCTIDTDTRSCIQEVKCLLLFGNHHLGSTRLDHPTGALTTLLTSASALRRELDARIPRLPLPPPTHVYLPRTTSTTPSRSTRPKDMPSSTPLAHRPWPLSSV
jgi:hypothetical protein